MSGAQPQLTLCQPSTNNDQIHNQINNNDQIHNSSLRHDISANLPSVSQPQLSPCQASTNNDQIHNSSSRHDISANRPSGAQPQLSPCQPTSINNDQIHNQINNDPIYNQINNNQIHNSSLRHDISATYSAEPSLNYLLRTQQRALHTTAHPHTFPLLPRKAIIRHPEILNFVTLLYYLHIHIYTTNPPPTYMYIN